MQVEGTIYWCKLDKLRPNYNKQRKIMTKDGEPDGWNDEWSVVLGNLDRDTKVALRDAGLLDKVKNKMDEKEDFITFRLSKTKKDGEENDPIRVVNVETMEDWDWKEDGLVGNGSKGVMKFNTWRSPNGKTSAFPVSLLVLEHVEYEGEEGAGDYEDPNDWSEYAPKAEKAKASTAKAKAKTKSDLAEDLDDDIPF